MAVWLAADFFARIRMSRITTVVITLAVLSGYAFVSYIQISYWRNSFTLSLTPCKLQAITVSPKTIWVRH